MPTNTHASSATRYQSEDLFPRTEINDLAELGPELDEGQLAVVAGGQSKDGGSDNTGGPCGSCH